MSLAKMIEEAPIENGVRVVWDNREFAAGTRLEITPAPLDGHRALIQDSSGKCLDAWVPDGTELDAAVAVLDVLLGIDQDR